MSISSSFNNALSGLAVSSRMAEVVSNNLSNSLTEGYGKRDVTISSARLGGVQIDGISRNVDPVVLGERRLADSSLANSERTSSALGQLEAVVGAPDDPFGLASRLTEFEKSLVSAASDPSSDSRLGTVVQRLNDLTTALSDASRKTQNLREEADLRIARDVEVLNASLEQVANLNKSIARARSTGGDTSALKDARQVAIDRLSEIVPVRELDRSNDAVALMTTGGFVLLDGRPKTYEFTPTPTIVADMEFSAGVLSGISVDGSPIDTSNGFGRLGGGSLSASFELRDSILTEAQFGLDEIAADLVVRFQDTAVDPSLSAGQAGLLTDQGNAFSVSNIAGLSGRLAVNAAVDPDAGGELWRLRDGVGATAQGPVGDSTLLRSFSAALENAQGYQTGHPERSASGHMSNLSTQIATDRLRAEEALSFETAKWELLKEAELANGVDSDEQLQRLLLIEQAYAANAKLIQTATTMLQTLMEI